MTVAIERIETEAYLPTGPLPYVDVLQLHEIFDSLAFRANTILVGPKGIAKTLSIAAWASSKKCPIVTFDCSEDVRRSHLIGNYILRGDETPYVLGPLTTAVEIANEVGQCILCLEEINALTPQMQKVLNPLGDFRRRIEVPECQRIFNLKEDAKLWLCGTMNTSVYGGVYELNEDLKSRFRMIPVDYPSKKAERAIIEKVISESVDKKTVTKVLSLAHETRQKTMNYALSTRDVVQIIEDIAASNVPTALRLASGKFEGTDRDTFLKRAESSFDIELR